MDDDSVGGYSNPHKVTVAVSSRQHFLSPEGDGNNGFEGRLFIQMILWLDMVNWKKPKQGLSSHSLVIIYSFSRLVQEPDFWQTPSFNRSPEGSEVIELLATSGKIAAAFGNLESLELSRNSLSGSVPRTLSKLQLTTLDASTNRLEGQIPVGDLMDTMNDSNS
ncbi:LRR RECEPTOR-LIKE SERINE/THREONINE-PROTEIN KINASE GSO1, partial [Salix viminalis]